VASVHIYGRAHATGVQTNLGAIKAASGGLEPMHGRVPVHHHVGS